MKRDLDLARNILLAVEQNKEATGYNPLHISIPNYSEEEISYHVGLLHEAGLIHAFENSSWDGVEWRPQRLTFQGHEFLDSARDENSWKQAKNKLEEVKNFSFEILKKVLVKLAERSLDGS